MRHPSALHRSEYPHISPPFLSCPCLQQSCLQQSVRRKKNTFDKRISNVQRPPIIAHEKNATLLSQHIVTIVTNVTAPTRTTSTPQQHPLQRPSRNATKQLRPLEQRATSQLQETHSHSQHTRPVCYQVTVVIVTVYHRIARRINCALSNDNGTRLPQRLL